jgi:hypothetical protein
VEERYSREQEWKVAAEILVPPTRNETRPETTEALDVTVRTAV